MRWVQIMPGAFGFTETAQPGQGGFGAIGITRTAVLDDSLHYTNQYFDGVGETTLFVRLIHLTIRVWTFNATTMGNVTLYSWG